MLKSILSNSSRLFVRVRRPENVSSNILYTERGLFILFVLYDEFFFLKGVALHAS